MPLLPVSVTLPGLLRSEPEWAEKPKTGGELLAGLPWGPDVAELLGAVSAWL